MPASADIRFANELHELHEFWVFGTPQAYQKPFCFVQYFSCNPCNPLVKSGLQVVIVRLWRTVPSNCP